MSGVVVTGVSGRLAQMVAQRLIDDGHEVIGIDRRPWPDAPKALTMYAVDVRKRAAEEVFRKHRPDAVIHMATVTHLVAKSDERYRINLGGTRAVFDYTRAYGVKQTIFVGRHTYYGAAADSPLYHTEDDPPMAVSTFPELSDLVAADLYATTALWRDPGICTSVLRICYTLGQTRTGTLAAYLKGPRVPIILGYDPLFQFMHELDVAQAICLALDKKIRGVFNVAGPQPVPLSVAVRGTGRDVVYLPEFVFNAALGRFGLPKLPPGALEHIKYPVVIDWSAFKKATGFHPEKDEAACMREFADTFPARPVSAANA